MRAADDAARLIVSQFAPGATEIVKLFHKPGNVLQDYRAYGPRAAG
jgi:hypothetical protein